MRARPRQTNSLVVGPHGSLPHPYRYQLHADLAIERLGTSDLAVDADDIKLTVGEHLQFAIVPTTSGAPAVLGGCSVSQVPQSKPPPPPVAAGHGCAGCAGASDQGSLLLIAVAIFLLARRRRP
jgi:MYXO-CTERM domain-containing protein